MREAFSMRVRCSFTFSETKTVNWYGLATRWDLDHGMVIILSLDDRRESCRPPAMTPARHKVQARERTQKEASSLIHVESEANRALRHQG